MSVGCLLLLRFVLWYLLGFLIWLIWSIFTGGQIFKINIRYIESVIKIHVDLAIDECDFRIYCGVLETQNRRSRENSVV